jgi:hypothetical protein
VIRLVLDPTAPYGPRVFLDGKEIENVFSIELLPLRHCIVKHHRLPLLPHHKAQFDFQAGQYEFAAEP